MNPEDKTVEELRRDLEWEEDLPYLPEEDDTGDYLDRAFEVL